MTRIVLSLALVAVIGSDVACASRRCKREDYKGVACRNGKIADQLFYGMPKAETLAALDPGVRAPWHNPYGKGPDAAANPFDERSFESAEGESYELVRYFVALSGGGECPLIEGRAQLEPLIFFQGELVGWSWRYFKDLVKRRLSSEEVSWRFAYLCDGSERMGARSEQ